MNSLFQIVLCFIFAIALFGWGNSNNAQIRWMRDNGIPATGKVTAVYPVFRIYINYAVEYKTADGNTELSSLSFADVVRLGDKVELLYNPGDDRSVMLASTQPDYALHVMSAIFFIIGLLGIPRRTNAHIN